MKRGRKFSTSDEKYKPRHKKLNEPQVHENSMKSKKENYRKAHLHRRLKTNDKQKILRAVRGKIITQRNKDKKVCRLLLVNNAREKTAEQNL